MTISSRDVDYAPTWIDFTSGDQEWIVYDASEGYQPAYALVSADHSSDACELAEEISNGRILYDSETLVCKKTSVSVTISFDKTTGPW
jgi:hypothetical protein